MTGKIEQRLQELGLTLPAPWIIPRTVPGVRLVRVHGTHVYVSGHVPLDRSGRVSGPFGKVGAEVSLEQAEEAARQALLAILASLKRELGSLDRIQSWLRVSGMVNTAPTFLEYPRVMNAASQVIADVFGPTLGSHARVAVGVAGLPFGAPVEIEAELSVAVEDVTHPIEQ